MVCVGGLVSVLDGMVAFLFFSSSGYGRAGSLTNILGGDEYLSTNSQT